MGFGAGHVQDMNNRMKQNRAQRPSSRSKFKENSRGGIYSKSYEKQPCSDFPKVSEKSLSEAKKRIKNQAKIEQKREQIFYVTFVICGVIMLIGFLIWMN